MTPVGGSRHYDGGGIGQVGVWDCPSCGEENTGPLAQGCTACGAGAPGRHVGATPPPAPPEAPEAPETPPAPQGDLATEWAALHPEATVAEAFREGYLYAVREVQRAEAQRQQAGVGGGEAIAYSPDQIINRTIVAALSLFRDQVLAGDPEETRTGEWLTQHQVNALIAQIQGAIHG